MAPFARVGKRSREDARPGELVVRAVRRPSEATDDEDSPALLGEAVVGGVDDPPLDLVPEVRKRREHHGEVTASLAAR